MKLNFLNAFEALTGKKPFPWQQRLYDDWFSQGKIPPACCLPTGLGKTSVIAIWLIALANGCAVPRRLIYVVNRRTVVDQTTEEVVKYKSNLAKAGITTDLAVSTLRGQFADNGDWCEDPSRPAVICGTVDMIGSRLLFSGYGIGKSKRPLHAGFLGQDALLIHDEAHLESAFQKLIEAIVVEQDRCKEFGKFQVMELTATSKTSDPFMLNDEDFKDTTVAERMNSAKALHLHPLSDPKKPAKELHTKASSFEDSRKAILIFATSVETVMEVAGKLPKDRVLTLTGTMRGKERDELITKPVFQRFLPGATGGEETVYLVCTSAGEVGVNISADHLVCDLTPFDSMAQRLGRVNRFGKFNECQVHVFHPTTPDEKDKLAEPKQKTLELLKKLNGQASPKALGDLDPTEKNAAFTPQPTILPVTDILFDAWALTTIRGKLPGRPPVEPYLHGVAEWQPKETQVAWRKEVTWFSDADTFDDEARSKVLEWFPLKPHETLKNRSEWVLKTLQDLAKKHPGHNAWVVDDEGTIEVVTLADFDGKDKEDIEDCTVLLEERSGGLNKQGLFDASAIEVVEDVGDIEGERKRVENQDVPERMHEVYRVTLDSEDEDAVPEVWIYAALKNTGEPTAKYPVTWCGHVGDVVYKLAEILKGLSLGEELNAALMMAAEFHDHGKKRAIFQTMLGNQKFNAGEYWAKSGKKTGRRLEEKYRHEFGSLHDLQKSGNALSQITPEMQDLVLHLIAAHHGRARPHFPADEVFDPASTPREDRTLAVEVPRRFGRLQRKYGRWGLAYLESLLRAADWAASSEPSEGSYVKGGAS